MADIVPMRDKVRVEDRTLFSSHTGTVYVLKTIGEDAGNEKWWIWAASPTAANFNEAPVGSYLIDTDLYTTIKVHNTATTWLSVTLS